MPKIPAPFLARVERDVVSTRGEQHRGLVADLARNAEQLDIDDPHVKLVDDVQQVFHDEYIDTCWPACPRHVKHPLWYQDGGWWCEQDAVRVCDLGQLGSRASREEG